MSPRYNRPRYARRPAPSLPATAIGRIGPLPHSDALTSAAICPFVASTWNREYSTFLLEVSWNEVMPVIMGWTGLTTAVTVAPPPQYSYQYGCESIGVTA